MNSSVALNKFRWQLQSVRLSLEREIKIRASQAGEAQRPQKILCQVYTMHLARFFGLFEKSLSNISIFLHKDFFTFEKIPNFSEYSLAEGLELPILLPKS